MADLLAFLRFVASEMQSGARHPIELSGSQQLAHAVERPPRNLSAESSAVAALGTLDSLPSHPLTDALRLVSSALPWTPSPRVDDGGRNVALAQLSDCVDLGELNVGIMLVGPDDAYPIHQHPPAEVYIVLGGEAEWRYGGSDSWVPRGTGELLFNHPHDRHGVRTSASPTVALWVLHETG